MVIPESKVVVSTVTSTTQVSTNHTLELHALHAHVGILIMFIL